jgi:hypothetical protein
MVTITLIEVEGNGKKIPLREIKKHLDSVFPNIPDKLTIDKKTFKLTKKIVEIAVIDEIKKYLPEIKRWGNIKRGIESRIESGTPILIVYSR